MKIRKRLYEQTYWVLPSKTYKILSKFSFLSFWGYLLSAGLGLPDYVSFLFVPGFFMMAILGLFTGEDTP